MDRWADLGGDEATVAAPTARRATMPARASAAPLGSWRSERDVQRHLQVLQARTAGIRSDLDDLQTSLTYQLLFDGQRVTGVTRSRLDASADAVAELWLGFAVLGDLLGEAAAVVGNGARPSLEELRDVEWQLFDDSVEVAGRRLTPDELLDELVRALSVTAQIVEDADDVWRRTVPALALCGEEVESLLQRTGELAASSTTESLRQLRAHVTWLQGQAAADPLGVVEAFERDVLPRLDQARVRLTDELRHHRAVAADLARAGARLRQLRELHARVVEEAGSVWARIAHPRGLVRPPDAAYLSEPPMGLEPWLARLQSLWRAGSYHQVGKGLVSWTQAADQALARELDVLDINQAPIRHRQELRGLLSSLQAKAAALGRGREPGLADIGSRARAILYATQTDLDEAALLVREYGDRLRVLNSEEVSYR